MDNFVKSFKIHSKIHLIYIISIVFVTATLICGYYMCIRGEDKVGAKEITKVKKKEEKKEKTIKVDVKGAVKNPGVYELKRGSRVIDAINIAGGLTDRANTSILNLSKVLEDAYVIVIYTDQDLTDVVMDKYVKNNLACPATINDACIIEEETVSQGSSNNTIEQTKSSKKQTSNSKTTTNKTTTTVDIINLNTATLEQLQTLPGIGESKAQAIITYREENGRFKSIDELTNVSGIGASTLEKIKNNITI